LEGGIKTCLEKCCGNTRMLTKRIAASGHSSPVLKEYDPVWVLEEQCKVRQVMANFKYRQYNNNAAAMQYCGIRLNIKKL